MRSNRVFRWIWRVNALTFLVCSVIFIAAISIALYPTVRDYVRRKPIYRASDMVNVEDNVKLNSEWSLGGFQQIKGTDFSKRRALLGNTCTQGELGRSR